MNENEFKNVINNQKSYHTNSFAKNIIVPFLSGVLGCSLVLGICFGVPSIKEKIIPKGNNTTYSSQNNSQNLGLVNTSMVSLTNYSDTAIFAANKILPSIVGISITYNVTTSSPFYSMFGQNQQSMSQGSGSGSGIIISEDGYIVTNNHVVDSSSSSVYYDISEATSIKVSLYGDDTQYDAKIVGKDSQTDLAVLKIEKTGLTAAEFADSDSVKVGEFAMAVGNPLDLGTSITCGIVSAVNRKVQDNEGKSNYTCIQTDAAINAGNSGGALVNSQGQVIGINTLKVSSTGVEGIGFAIPINSTTDIINQLITYKAVKRPYIGISARDLNDTTAQKYNLRKGIYILSIDEYSAAEKAGLKIGDVIFEVDGKEVSTMNELNDIKNTHSIGDTLKLKINRDGQEKEITLTLGEQHSN
jgi:serine protease Do